MLTKVRIKKHERGLLFRYGDFLRLLEPGTYRLWTRLYSRQRAEIQVYDTLATKFEHPLLDVIAAREDVREALEIVDLKDDERGLVWKDDRLAYIVGPGRHAFWKTANRIAVEVFNVRDTRLVHPRLKAILNFPGALQHLDAVWVEPHERTALFLDGELVEVLQPGAYAFWKRAGRPTWKSVDLRERLADVAGQEIMTSDKVTLRVNLLVTYQVSDVLKAVTVVGDYEQTLYREAQLVLRAAIGGRNLDSLLSDKDAVGEEVRRSLTARAAEFGLTVRSAGLRDVILPGEMKAILNQVIAAEKQAQANLIKRREETAAARSQANTARLLAENPALARIKELEALQDILAGVKATFVLGPGDLAGQVRSLIRAGEPDDG